MAYWGSGAPWGSGDPWGAPGEFSAQMLTRLLMFVRHDPNFVAIVNALSTRTELVIDAAKTVTEAFDLDTAVGVQLDVIGVIVNRPRWGLADDRYRALIKAHIDLILSSTSTAETLLAVVLAITGSPAPDYEEFYPAQFRISAIVDPDEVTLLQSLLRQAKGWGIYGAMVAFPDGATATEGTLLGDLVADEGVWSTVIDDRTWAARMTSTGADDLETTQDGVLDGTTHVPAFDARNFNGTTDRIDWLTSPLNLSLPQACTIAGWVRIETLGGLRVLWVASSTAPAQALLLRTNGSALEVSRAYSPGTSLQRISTAVLSTGVWYHVAATVPGTATAANHRLYLNGVEMSYATTTDGSGTERTAGGAWSLGGRIESDANCSDGDIASMDVWPRVLGPEEIWHLYSEGIASGAFAGPPDEVPSIDNPGVGDLVTPTYALAYPTATLVTV